MASCYIPTPVIGEIESVPAEGYAPFYFSPTGDELLFRFTDESFTRVLSSLQNGAWLTYPTDGQQVIWDFLQNVEFPLPFCEALINCILNDADTKAALATVIMTDPGIQDAIRDFVISDPAINQHVQDIASQTVLSLGERGTNLLKPEACDFGYTFNQASTFVFLLDRLARDLFQAIEVGTNTLERGGLLLSAIPGLGLLPFDEILQLGDKLVAEVEEDYEGAYDEGTYDDLRCGLWCEVKDSCELSIDDALAFYQNLAGESLPEDPIETLQYIGQLILTGDLPGELTVYAMHLLVIACMRAGQELFGINFAQLGIRIVAAGDESDNDWELLCDECVEPPTDGQMEIFLAASPLATLELISKVGAEETFRVTAEILPNTFWYASIRRNVAGAWRVDSVTLESGTFYQWSSVMGIQTPLSAAEGTTYPDGAALDIYCTPGTQAVYVMTVTLL